MVDSLALVDANVLVRYLVADDRGMQARAKRLIESGRPLGITTVAVLETAHVLHRVYGYPHATIIDTLVALLTRHNMVGVGVDRDQLAAKLLLCRSSGTVSFGDALLAATAATAGLDSAYSFDEKLSRSGLVALVP